MANKIHKSGGDEVAGVSNIFQILSLTNAEPRKPKEEGGGEKVSMSL